MTPRSPSAQAEARRRHRETHRSERVGWLRAAVLGANDGIVSVAGLVVGVAASGASPAAILASGIAGTVAGAMSMAAGEYVSVRSQADTERADIAVERRELREDPDSELAELAHIYVQRGLTPELAQEVARQLTAHDALGSHARDELGITETLRARPVQAALASALAFVVGAALPIAAVLAAPAGRLEAVAIPTTLVALSISGGLAAWAGGAPILRGAARVAFWGALAMAAASLVGRLFDVTV
ncbi:VIT1/CCC1 transporter family protein [Lysobacter antibioticus]|uniref:VIT1/CCC1 transporter family protein n=1 Tax=Lysobacter TaxID=68 RepID=UPI0005695A89|nr:VIT family protein [Lysobacter antibioticus]